MSRWPSTKAKLVLAALLRSGWQIKREGKGSHRVLAKGGVPDVVFSHHDRDEIGPRMLARIAKRTGLKPEDLRGRRKPDAPSEDTADAVDPNAAGPKDEPEEKSAQRGSNS